MNYAPKLAARAQELFPNHPYREHVAAFECRARYRSELIGTDGKPGLPQTLACVRRYLRDFPNGRYRDELEWLGVRLEHWTYEFEGDPEPALRQAHAFESYLEQRPKHERRSEIELRIAYLYYLAQEFISEKDEGAEAFPAADAGTYRARAEAIYARLSNATDPAVAAEARIQLFNLREGRRISVNANKW